MLYLVTVTHANSPNQLNLFSCHSCLQATSDHPTPPQPWHSQPWSHENDSGFNERRCRPSAPPKKGQGLQELPKENRGCGEKGGIPVEHLPLLSKTKKRAIQKPNWLKLREIARPLIIAVKGQWSLWLIVTSEGAAKQQPIKGISEKQPLSDPQFPSREAFHTSL